VSGRTIRREQQRRTEAGQTQRRHGTEKRCSPQEHAIKIRTDRHERLWVERLISDVLKSYL
jgi:hypothetical protein